jgi:TetR/AcrR family acrAB operon transcriptional repressor
MRKTKEEAEKTKSKILKSALNVFLKKGYSRTTLTDIAEHAGFTRGAVYWHFNDKSELLEVLILKFHNRFFSEQQMILESDLDPIHKIDKMININFPMLYNNKEFRDFIELTWFKTEIDQFEGLLQGKIAITKSFNDTLASLFKDASQKGFLKEDVNSEIAALTVTSIINGIYRGYFVIPDKLQEQEVGIDIIQNYLNQLKSN